MRVRLALFTHIKIKAFLLIFPTQQPHLYVPSLVRETRYINATSGSFYVFIIRRSHNLFTFSYIFAYAGMLLLFRAYKGTFRTLSIACYKEFI